jgi:ABC-type nitrate/sulfonate/bicarbonate transport system substrate-binding protein
MKSKYIYIGLTVFFLCIIAVSIKYLIFTPPPTTQSAQTNKPLQDVIVRLAWLNQAQFAGMYVAQEKGYYKDAGLNVNLKEYAFDIDQAKELSQGDIQFSVSSASEFIKGRSNKYPITAIAVVFQDSPYAFASLKSKNILTPADFKGKVLGREGGNDQAKITYAAVFKQFGIKDNDVKYVDLQFDEVNDLGKNRADVIDLYRTDQPFLIKKSGLDINLIYPERFGFEQYGDTIATSDKLIKENPSMVKAFIQATIKGWEYAIANPKEAVDIVLKYDNAKYHDKEYETYIMTQNIPLIKPTGGQQIGEMKFIRWHDTYDALLQAGSLDNTFDIEQAYTNKFIK